MNESTAWREIKYEEVFEREIRGLSRRRDSDPACRPEDLEGTLQHLYIMDGSDWVGRGELQDIIMAATIAAYEHFISEWRREQNHGMEGESHSGKRQDIGRRDSQES